MRTRSFILLALLVTLSGCIVTYRDFPTATLESLPKNHEPKPFAYHVEPIPTTLFTSSTIPDKDPTILFFIIPNWYPLGMKDFREAGVREVQRTLETSGMFSELIIEGHLIEAERLRYKGTYCDIQFSFSSPSEAAVWTSLGQAVPSMVIPPLFVLGFDPIPYYSGEGGFSVSYLLYREGKHQETYRYTIRKKGVGGILFLPFAWLNFFTNDLKDAVRGTTLQFLIDAQRDGNL